LVLTKTSAKSAEQLEMPFGGRLSKHA